MTKYSIKEISLAWDSFTVPTYLISERVEVALWPPQRGAIPTEDTESIHRLPIDYSRWIPYLISEEWKNPQTQKKIRKTGKVVR